MSSISPDVITLQMQQFFVQNGVPLQIAQQITIQDVMNSVWEMVPPDQRAEVASPTTAYNSDSHQETQAAEAAAASFDPELSEKQSSPARDSVFGDHADVSKKAQDAQPPPSTPVSQDAFESPEPVSPSGDSLFDIPNNDSMADFSAKPSQQPPAAQDTEPQAEMNAVPASPTQQHEELNAPEEIPEILTPELAVLVPSANALSTNATRFASKYQVLQRTVEYLASRLAAVCITLVRCGLPEKAVPIGQFTVDLFGPSIFATVIHMYETAPPEGDDFEACKRCLSECISLLLQEFSDQKRMATKLTDIAVAQQMYVDPAVFYLPVGPLPKSRNGVSRKVIDKKSRYGAHVKGVARKITRVVRAGPDDLDQWQ